MSYSWQYLLYTVMVFDELRNGIPVAYFIISSSTENALKHVLAGAKGQGRLYECRLGTLSIIVDNVQAKLNVLE